MCQATGGINVAGHAKSAGSDDVRHTKGGQGINAIGSDEGNEDFASGNGTTAGGNGGKDKMDNEVNIASGSSNVADHTVTIIVGGSKKTYIASTHPIGPDANGLQQVQDKAMPYNATDVHAHGCPRPQDFPSDNATDADITKCNYVFLSS
ncbi:hypothetical protein Tco_0032412 [Tanacetum coccineum]